MIHQHDQLSQSPEVNSLSNLTLTPSNIKTIQTRDQSKLDSIRSNIIGLQTRYRSPFYMNLEAVYVDHTATNRPYKPIQTVINHTKRIVANPHTEFSRYGKFSTKMVEYAQQSLLKTFSADKDKYVVLPVGSGSTGAVQKTIHIIQRLLSSKLDEKIKQLKQFADKDPKIKNIVKQTSDPKKLEDLISLLDLTSEEILKKIQNLREQIHLQDPKVKVFIKELIKEILDFRSKPQIFITPYEHHSNILPWIQLYGHINELETYDDYTLNYDKIEEQIRKFENNKIIVSISAASNVTSQITDLKRMNQIIKNLRNSQPDKTFIFAIDCAAFCCHSQLKLDDLDQVDFVYISPHKNLGASQTSGLLIARKSLVPKTPTFPGGGTIIAVYGYDPDKDIFYDQREFAREVAGTPPFLGFYRTALSFELLKNDIGYEYIHSREVYNSELFFKQIMRFNEDHFTKYTEKNSDKQFFNRILIYGPQDLSKRKNVFSLNIVRGGRLIHYNIISQILTDVFGIQVRSGCFCAGPFGVKLLKLSDQKIEQLENDIKNNYLKTKPGLIRLDLTFYLESWEVTYIIQAIKFTALYCDNMEKIYTINDKNQIQRNVPMQKEQEDRFQLFNYKQFEQVEKCLEKSHTKRLENRQTTLLLQLENGIKILKDPIGWLQKHKNQTAQ